MTRTIIIAATIFVITINGLYAQNVQVQKSTNAVRILKGSQKPPFDSVQITKVQIAKEKPFDQNTCFEVSIKNNSKKVIEKFSLAIMAKEKGRTIPLASNEVEFEPKSGLEPGETKVILTSANPFGQRKWYSLTLEEINKAEITAELISITFYKEKKIKSDSINAKNADTIDQRIIVPQRINDKPIEIKNQFEKKLALDKFVEKMQPVPPQQAPPQRTPTPRQNR